MPVYYVSNTGNDANAGTTEATAWQTIARVNNAAFVAGDQVRFQGGQTFAGNLVWTRSGTATAICKIGSYGTGRATINAGNGTGIHAPNVAWIEVEDLNFTGSGATVNRGCGVRIYNDVGTFTGGFNYLDHAVIRRCTASGFGGAFGPNAAGTAGILEGAGFYVGGDGWKTYGGYTGIRIEDCDAHSNQHLGIYLTGFSPNQAGHRRANKNVDIVRCRAWDNPGGANPHNWTGCGIFVEESEDGLVDLCEAWNNGVTGKIPVGIWAAGSARITFRSCVSHDNKTSTADGGGFDADGGCEDCVFEYCYSYNNDGYGFFLFNYLQDIPKPYCRRNVIRFCVSVNDNAKLHPDYGGITIDQVPGSVLVEDSRVYCNTVYYSRGGGRASFVDLGTATKSYNNLIMSNGQRPVVMLSAQASHDYRGNRYYAANGSTPTYVWGGTTYTGLAAFRTASGKETGTGSEGDPMVTNIGAVPSATASTMTTIAAYEAITGSPLPTAGIDIIAALQALSLNRGSRDYWNSALPADGRHVSADAVASAAADAPPPAPTPPPPLPAAPATPAGAWFAVNGIAYLVLADGVQVLEPETARGEATRAFDGTLVSTAEGEVPGWRVPLREMTPTDYGSLRSAIRRAGRVTVGGTLFGAAREGGFAAIVQLEDSAYQHERDGTFSRVPVVTVRAVDRA